VPALNFSTVNFSSAFLNHCTSTNTYTVELGILEVTLFLLILHDSLVLFWNRVNNHFLYTLLNISVCRLKICLPLSRTFSVDREDLMSHIRHKICI